MGKEQKNKGVDRERLIQQLQKIFLVIADYNAVLRITITSKRLKYEASTKEGENSQ